MRILLSRLLILLAIALPINGYASTFFKDLDGKVHTVDEFTGQGKWAIVMLWASDCHICNREAHQYVKFHAAHKDQDAIVLGISMDGDAKLKEAKAFVARHAVNFTNLIGKPDQVAAMFSDLTGSRFVGTPTFLIFAPDGELKAQQAGAVPVELIEKFMANN